MKIFLTKDILNYLLFQHLGKLVCFFRTESSSDILHNKKNEVDYIRVKSENFVIYLRSFQDGFANSEFEGITFPAYTIIRFVDDNQDFYFWKYIFTSQKFIN